MARLSVTVHLGCLLAAGGGCSNAEKSYEGADTAIGVDPAPPSAEPGGDATASTPGAEVEDDLPGLAPAQTDVYVFVASPERNTVTRIHVQTHELRTVPVGLDPRVVLTTPDNGTAVVFNRGDDTVTLLAAHDLSQRVVPVRQDLNAMRLSPDGTFAVLWHDKDAEHPDDPPASGSQSFNEVSFVEIATGAHYPMAVGYDPHGVEFTDDSKLAVVVADDALALVDLTQTPLLPDMVTISDALEPPRAEELVLSPDGTWGFLRQFGATELLVLDLEGRGLDPVAVGANPTDLDILPDGSAAVALARTDRQLWIYDLDDPFAPASIHPLPGTAEYGQLVFSPKGDQALLFTNATPTDRVAIWNIQTGAITERATVKPVNSVAITPTGGSALIFHTLEDVAGADLSPFLGEWALTLMDLDDYRTNPLLLPAEPIGFANAADGSVGYFVMDGQKYLEVLRFDTLLYDQVAIPSVPVFVGVLPDLLPGDGLQPPAWVSQEHDLGRISLYDADSGSLETITGFELNSGIE